LRADDRGSAMEGDGPTEEVFVSAVRIDQLILLRPEASLIFEELCRAGAEERSVAVVPMGAGEQPVAMHGDRLAEKVGRRRILRSQGLFKRPSRAAAAEDVGGARVASSVV